MTKVIQFIHGMTMGGAETLVKDYCIGIDKSKFDITLLCSIKYGVPYEKILEDAGIRIVFINDYTKRKPQTIVEKFFIKIRRYFFIRSFLRKEKPDVLHVHLGLLEYVRFANPKCKIFYTVHNDPDFVWGNNKKEENAAKWLCKNKNMKFISLSEEMRIKVNNRFGVSDSIIVNNGINFSRFEEKIDSTEYKRKLGIPENSFVMGNIARFRDEKNHEFLINIFFKVLEKKTNAFLLLIGDGELKNKIVTILKGFEDKYLILSNRTDIPQLFQCMDCFVLSSKVEGLGIVLIEAQKSGVKCIAPQNVVPDETRLSNLIDYLDLSEGVEKWVDAILKEKKVDIEYYGIDEWNMENVIHKLEMIYVSNV